MICGTVPLFVCPSAPSGIPSDYGAGYTAIGYPPDTPLVLPRTDYAPLRGLHPSLAACVGLPADFTHNAMLGTTDYVNKRTVDRPVLPSMRACWTDHLGCRWIA